MIQKEHVKASGWKFVRKISRNGFVLGVVIGAGAYAHDVHQTNVIAEQVAQQTSRSVLADDRTQKKSEADIVYALWQEPQELGPVTLPISRMVFDASIFTTGLIAAVGSAGIWGVSCFKTRDNPRETTELLEQKE